jgi:hypothetical protein
MRKYSIIYMVSVGYGANSFYQPRLLRITCSNLDTFLKNNPYYDDIQMIFDGHVKELNNLDRARVYTTSS